MKDLRQQVEYVQEELGVFLFNLTSAELRQVADAATRLSQMSAEDRDELMADLDPEHADDIYSGEEE